jgi:putative membrane protein
MRTRSLVSSAAALAMAVAVASTTANAQGTPPTSGARPTKVTKETKDTTRTTTSGGEPTRSPTAAPNPTAAPTPTPTPTPTPPDTSAAPQPSAAPGVMPGAPMNAPSDIVGSLRTDAHAMALLHESNQAEIQAGTLAQRQATDSDVRAFAAQMVSDHTALDAQGSALATRLAITPMLPDSALPRMAAQELTTLRGGPPNVMPSAAPANPPRDTTRGAANLGFDRAYIAQQVADHQRTLALVDAAIAQTQNAQLKTALQNDVRPKVATHLQMAQQLQQRLGTR